RLSVTSRAESVLYKHTTKPLDQIGRELNANTVLRGTILHSGDRVWIFTELVATSNGRQLWSETYERSPSELSTVESEVFRGVSGALRITLADIEKQRLAENRKLNPEAYDLYLRALSHVVRTDEKDLDEAIA